MFRGAADAARSLVARSPRSPLAARAPATSGVLDRVEDATVDLRFGLRGAQPADDIAVVAIDDADVLRARACSGRSRARCTRG